MNLSFTGAINSRMVSPEDGETLRGMQQDDDWKSKSEIANAWMEEMGGIEPPPVNTPHNPEKIGKMEPGGRLRQWKAKQRPQVKTSGESTGAQTPRTARSSPVFSLSSNPQKSSRAENMLKKAAKSEQEKDRQTEKEHKLDHLWSKRNGGRRRTRKRRRKRTKRRRKRRKTRIRKESKKRRKRKTKKRRKRKKTKRKK